MGGETKTAQAERQKVQRAEREARVTADHYIATRGQSGAQEKLAQLQARKTKSDETKMLIAALQAKLGSAGAPRVGNRPGKA